jgi:putative spermidine/putrescine transport system substrate-binding protein
MVKEKMTRRSFLKKGVVAAGLVAGAGPLVLLPRKGQAAADKGPIVFCTYGGPYGENMQKYVIDSFTKKTGIQVIRTSTPAFAKVKAMVDTGNIEWDVVDAESRLYFRGIKINLFTPLDWNVIGHKNELVPGSAETMGAGNVFFCGVISWSKKKFSRETAPKGWVDFFKFPGKRTIRGEAFHTLEAAAMGDGIPKDKVYPIDLERAFKVLSAAKKGIIFWANTKMALDLLISGEVDFGSVGIGPILTAIEAGEPVDYTWNQGTMDKDFLVIPKGSKQVESAMKFIAHCMDPEVQGAYSTNYNVGPSNTKAIDFIPEQRRALIPTSPKNLPLIFIADGRYWAENEETVAKRFEQWMTSS